MVFKRDISIENNIIINVCYHPSTDVDDNMHVMLKNHPQPPTERNLKIFNCLNRFFIKRLKENWITLFLKALSHTLIPNRLSRFNTFFCFALYATNYLCYGGPSSGEIPRDQ